MAEEQAVGRGRGKLFIVNNCAGPDGPSASPESGTVAKCAVDKGDISITNSKAGFVSA